MRMSVDRIVGPGIQLQMSQSYCAVENSEASDKKKDSATHRRTVALISAFFLPWYGNPIGGNDVVPAKSVVAFPAFRF